MSTLKFVLENGQEKIEAPIAAKGQGKAKFAEFYGKIAALGLGKAFIVTPELCSTDRKQGMSDEAHFKADVARAKDRACDYVRKRIRTMEDTKDFTVNVFVKDGNIYLGPEQIGVIK